MTAQTEPEFPKATRCDLVSELSRCELDTGRLLAKGAAVRLSKWRRYEHNESELIAFVQRVLRGEQRIHGWELEQKGGRSLERIVIDCGAPPFTADDIRIAKETLGI